MQHPHAHEKTSINDTLRSALAIRASKDWNLDLAIEMGKRLCEGSALFYEYDDGPPENWLNLTYREGQQEAIISIYVPAVFVVGKNFSEEFYARLLKEDIAWMQVRDWETDEHVASGEVLTEVLGSNYTGRPVLEVPMCFRDFWVITVT